MELVRGKHAGNFQLKGYPACASMALCLQHESAPGAASVAQVGYVYHMGTHLAEPANRATFMALDRTPDRIFMSPFPINFAFGRARAGLHPRSYIAQECGRPSGCF